MVEMLKDVSRGAVSVARKEDERPLLLPRWRGRDRARMTLQLSAPARVSDSRELAFLPNDSLSSCLGSISYAIQWPSWLMYAQTAFG